MVDREEREERKRNRERFLHVHNWGTTNPDEPVAEYELRHFDWNDEYTQFVGKNERGEHIEVRLSHDDLRYIFERVAESGNYLPPTTKG